MKELEVRAWDDTRLHVEVHGRPVGEAPAVVLVDGIGCDGFVWRYLLPQLEPNYTVVHGHYRGHGRSGQAPRRSHYTMADNVKDILAFMDAAGVERAVLMGHSMGVQVSIEAALVAPERVSGLVLLCGSFGRPLDTWHDHTLLKVVLPLARAVTRPLRGPIQELLRLVLPTDLSWAIAQAEVDGRRLKREDFLPYLRHLGEMDPLVFLDMLSEAAGHTTEGRLEEVAVPALVIGGEHDKFTPFWVSEVMAERLPGGELHMVSEGTHTAPLEAPEWTGALVDEWLGRCGFKPQQVGQKPQSGI